MSSHGNSQPPRGDYPVPQTSTPHLPAPPVSFPSTALGVPSSRGPWGDAADAGDGINLLSFMHSIRRRLVISAVIGSLVATIVAGLVFYFVPVRYEAITLIRVKRDERDILSRLNSTTDRTYESYKQTQRALISSQFVISAALRKPGISQLRMVRAEENPVAWIEEELRVDNPKESEVLRIAIYGSNSDEAVKLVNAISGAYMEEVVHAERMEMVGRLEVLRSNYLKSVTRTKEKTDQYIKMTELLGTSDASSIAMKERLAIAELSAAKTRVIDLESKLRETTSRLRLARELNDVQFNPSEYQIIDYLMAEPEYAFARQQFKMAEDMVREVGNRVKPNTPSAQRTLAPLQSAKRRLEQIEAELKPRIVERIKRQYGSDPIQYEQNIRLLTAEYLHLTEQLAKAESQHRQFADDMTRLGGVSADIEARKDELESLRHMTNVVKAEIDALELNLDSPARIQVIQEAVVPDASDWIWVWSEIGGAWLLSFGLIVGGIAYWDYTGRRVNGPSDVTAARTSLRVLGTLPMLYGLRTGSLWPFGRNNSDDTQAILNYSIDSIRTAIMFNDGRRPVDVVMITSAGGEEGRTTVASQLAVSLARSGRRTLLLDGDMRNPQQHLVFGIPFSSGFCEMLRNDVSADEVIHTTTIDNLWLLPAGYCCEESVQALSDGSLQEIFEALRAQFDFIVIDTGPALSNADPLLLGQHADTSILSVRRDVSQVPKIEAACDRLRSVGIHVMGAVINGGTAELRRNELRITADSTVTSEAHANPEEAV